MGRDRHPWPTDGITKRQMDKQIDRLDRLVEHRREQHVALKKRVAKLEELLRVFVPPHEK